MINNKKSSEFVRNPQEKESGAIINYCIDGKMREFFFQVSFPFNNGFLLIFNQSDFELESSVQWLQINS